MSFDQGTCNVTFYTIPSNLPEDFLEKFLAKRAGILSLLNEEPQFGWVSGKHLLDTDFDLNRICRGDFFHLTLRKGLRTIPGSFLRVLRAQAEDNYLKEHQEAEFVPRKVRKEIEEGIKAQYLPEMPPSLSGIELVIDPAEKLLYVGATSVAQNDLLKEHFIKTLGMEPLQLTPGSMLADEFDTNETAFPSVSFVEGAAADEFAIGRDFLTYLWYASETGVSVTDPEFGKFDVLVEAPFYLLGLEDAPGAGELVLKKGEHPTASAEAKSALSVGKKLRKAKIHFARENQSWSCTFDADSFAFSGIKLPEGDEMKSAKCFEERMEFLFVFQKVVRLYFHRFASMVLAADFATVGEKELQSWVSQRQSL
ncbi:MAG: recombination-associated protein RdgC [Victivallaceae bacterium]|nr:recombination-associated protein RdgC [Victivallaceae bacterium]